MTEYTVEQRQEFVDYCHSNGIPDHMIEPLAGYVYDGRPTGGFLRALLANDFMEAAGGADDKNIEAFRAYAIVFYNQLPNLCRGSYFKVDKWVSIGGFIGFLNLDKDARDEYIVS